jgi:hypothetical protein
MEVTAIKIKSAIEINLLNIDPPWSPVKGHGFHPPEKRNARNGPIYVSNGLTNGSFLNEILKIRSHIFLHITNRIDRQGAARHQNGEGRDWRLPGNNKTGEPKLARCIFKSKKIFN